MVHASPAFLGRERTDRRIMMIGAVIDLRFATLNLDPSSRVPYRRSRRLWLTRRPAETRSLSSETSIRSDPQQSALTVPVKRRHYW